MISVLGKTDFLCHIPFMYIRRTSIKSRKDGGQYYTYRIVESQRVGKSVRQRTILNLGTEFSLPREQWPDLNKRIEEILSGQQSLLGIDKNIEKVAQQCTSRIMLQQQDANESSGIDYREVDVDFIGMSRSRSVGCEHVSLEALRLLNRNCSGRFFRRRKILQDEKVCH